jgi:hypothetical protein
MHSPQYDECQVPPESEDVILKSIADGIDKIKCSNFKGIGTLKDHEPLIKKILELEKYECVEPKLRIKALDEAEELSNELVPFFNHLSLKLNNFVKDKKVKLLSQLDTKVKKIVSLTEAYRGYRKSIKENDRIDRDINAVVGKVMSEFEPQLRELPGVECESENSSGCTPTVVAVLIFIALVLVMLMYLASAPFLIPLLLLSGAVFLYSNYRETV